MMVGSHGPSGAFTIYRPPWEGFFKPPAMRVVADRVWPVNCLPEIGASDSFSKSVRRGGCSQAGKDILAQNTAVLRYATHFILKKRAQKNASFSGIGVYVLAHLQLSVEPNKGMKSFIGARESGCY